MLTMCTAVVARFYLYVMDNAARIAGQCIGGFICLIIIGAALS